MDVISVSHKIVIYQSTGSSFSDKHWRHPTLVKKHRFKTIIQHNTIDCFCSWKLISAHIFTMNSQMTLILSASLLFSNLFVSYCTLSGCRNSKLWPPNCETTNEVNFSYFTSSNHMVNLLTTNYFSIVRSYFLFSWTTKVLTKDIFVDKFLAYMNNLFLTALEDRK